MGVCLFVSIGNWVYRLAGHLTLHYLFLVLTLDRSSPVFSTHCNISKLCVVPTQC